MSSPPLTQNIQDITTSQLEALLDRPLSLDDIEDTTHGMSVTEVLEEMAKCRVETKDIELRCLRLMKSRGIDQGNLKRLEDSVLFMGIQAQISFSAILNEDGFYYLIDGNHRAHIMLQHPTKFPLDYKVGVVCYSASLDPIVYTAWISLTIEFSAMDSQLQGRGEHLSRCF